MEYFIIIALQFVGVGLHVMQKVGQFDKTYPDKNIKQIFGIFWEEDWNTIFISALVIMLNVLTHFIIDNYANDVTKMSYYHLYAFAIALLLGYAGQRLVYKYLGTAENVLNKKVDDLNK